MEELISNIIHQKELIDIHIDGIQYNEDTIARMGALTPVHIRMEVSDRKSKVAQSIETTLDFFSSEFDFQSKNYKGLGILLNQLELLKSKIELGNIIKAKNIIKQIIDILRNPQSNKLPQFDHWKNTTKSSLNNTNNTEKEFSVIPSLIAAGKTKDAIAILLTLVDNFDDDLKKIIILNSNKFNTNHNNQLMGVIDRDTYQLYNAQVNYSILDVYDVLKN